MAISRRVGLKEDTNTYSGVSSITRVVPVSDSNTLMFRPSLPIMRPFMASSGIFTIETVADCGSCGTMRCMESTSILRASASISRFDFSRISDL